MARGFGSTYGTSATADYVKTGYSTAPSTNMSYSIWAYIHGAGGNNFGDLWSQAGPSNLFNSAMNMNGGTSTMTFNACFTSGGGFWTFPCPSLNAWHHILAVFNGSSSSNVPTVYVDGVSQTLSILQAPSGSFNTSTQNYYIGNCNPGYVSGTLTFNGKIAEFAVWSSSLLTTSEAKALAKGVPPLLVRPSGLSLYVPLLGLGTGEPDWGPSHVTQTIGGAKAQNHAPVTFWMPPSPLIAPPSIPSWRRPGLSYRRVMA